MLVGLLTTFTVFLVLVGLAGPIIFVQIRKVFREQKDFERGLKMVPLLIHLPPLSEDAEIGGRDTRDVLDENISKAQVLYNIVAGTVQKGFKSDFYGQRHFSFEVVGHKGFVNFYAAVPVALAEVVKQAVVSAYPSARMEEVSEHNIFSPVGKISGTTGGELTLKENYAYPIATYQELKRDAMQSMLNALSTLDKEDGVGIQIMVRPAPAGWRKNAAATISKKRKGKAGKKSFGDNAFWYIKQTFIALTKPPEDKSGGGEKSDLSGADQTIVDAMDEKTRYPGFEVLVRVVASSNIVHRSQAILNNVVASFSLFDAPGRNGFKFTPAKDIEAFTTAYILRLFPQEINKNVLNSVELATLFHFPDQRNIPTSQLAKQASRQVDGPRNVPEDGLLLGYNIFRGAKKAIRLSLEDRRRHMYVVGQTGVGKSIFLENLALQDMLAGRGFAFVDPHGETVERLMSMVPRERTEDVIYFCPADMDYPMGLNLFEFDTPEQKDFLIQEAIGMLYKLYDPQHQGIIGPRYEHWFRNAALTLMSDPEGSTFIDIPKVFTDNKYAKQKLKHVTDLTVLDFWNKEMAQTSDYHKSEVLGWFVSKFGAFLSNEMMRNIIGQTKSSFNLRDVMDNKKILFVNLSKGRTGELNSKLLGMIFVMKFQAAAMSRATMAEEDRQDFCLYVDEFQNFSTDSFATILSEARKYRLNLIVANQFTTQLTEEIRDAVFGNVGSIVSFRVGADADADALSKKFQPVFDREDVLRLPNYNTITQILIGGVPTHPFSMATIPPLGTPNAQLSQALKQLSAVKYGRAKASVESEIFSRLATKEEPKPTPSGEAPYGTPPTQYGAKPAGGARPAPQPSSGSSFLDDWFAKRNVKPAPLTAPLAAPQQVVTANPPTPAPTNTAQQQSTVVVAAADPAAVTSPALPLGDKIEEPKVVDTTQVPAEASEPSSKAVGAEVSKVDQTAVDSADVSPRDTPGGAVRGNSSTPTDEVVVTDEEEAGDSGTAQGTPAETTEADETPVIEVVDEPEPQQERKTSGMISIKNNDGQQLEDTIVIDRDGTFHNNDPNNQDNT